MPEAEKTFVDNQTGDNESQNKVEEQSQSNGTNADPQGNGNPSGNSAEQPKTNVQSPEKNAEFAEIRRLKEEIKALKKERQENVNDGALTAFGFTRDDLNDSDNMALTQAYSKAVANGSENPKEEAYRSLFEKKKAEAREKAKLDSNIQKDIEQFGKEHPGENVGAIVRDPDFLNYYDTVYKPLGIDINGNVSKIYNSYLKISKKGTYKPTETQVKTATPPNPNGQSAGTPTDKEPTEAEVLKMSDEDFNKYIDNLVHKH